MSDQVKIDRLTERLAAAEALVTELRALLQHEQLRADKAEKRADVALTLADQTLSQLAKANDRADQTEKRAELAWTLMERWAASEKDARREVVDVQGDLQRVRQEADDQQADIAHLDIARSEARQARDAVQKAEHIEMPLWLSVTRRSERPKNFKPPGQGKGAGRGSGRRGRGSEKARAGSGEPARCRSSSRNGRLRRPPGSAVITDTKYICALPFGLPGARKARGRMAGVAGKVKRTGQGSLEPAR